MGICENEGYPTPVDLVDTPQTVMTTNAPAVLKSLLFEAPALVLETQQSQGVLFSPLTFTEEAKYYTAIYMPIFKMPSLLYYF